jgi:hypothetical protein
MERLLEAALPFVQAPVLALASVSESEHTHPVGVTANVKLLGTGC